MVCVRVAFQENDGNHENHENDEDNSNSYKQEVECWIHGNHGNLENDENYESPGCKPQVPHTTSLEMPEYWAWTFSFVFLVVVFQQSKQRNQTDKQRHKKGIWSVCLRSVPERFWGRVLGHPDLLCM